MTDILGDSGSAIFTTLKAGTALTALLAGTTAIYDQQAPDGATLPYVVFSHQGGGPDLITSANMENNLWFVRAYTSASSQHASAIFAEVDALLHKKNIAIGSLNTFWCAREENLQLVETEPNQAKVWMRGGSYRIRTS
jgi:Protein of unknown function (DUF3168)